MSLSADDLDRIREIVGEEIRDGLKIVGLDACDPMESQADLQFLRRSRKLVESSVTRAILTVIGLLVAGLVGVTLAAFRK